MTVEPATHKRIRAAVGAAHDPGTSTRLAGSTELSLQAAAEYAANFIALERLRDEVHATVVDGALEIGPGASRRVDGSGAASEGERRRGGDRRSGRERRHPKAP